MHEVSLVRSLLSQVAQLVAEHHGCGVERIEVEIGPLSGVEPLLVKSAFEQLAPNSASRQAELMIHEIPLTAHCEDCHLEFDMESFHFQCPQCRSAYVRIIRGDAFRLLNVTIQQRQSVEAEAL